MDTIDGSPWRKSSYSGGNGGECVEVGTHPDGPVLVRDSKDPNGPTLSFPAVAWRNFVTANTELVAIHAPSAAFAAVDVQYLPSGAARAALVLATDASFSNVVAEKTALVPEVEPYQPGEFYRRELPPLRAVLGGVTDIRLLIIDGYVDLDPDGRRGLGAHVHEEFGIPVIGVAKARFPSALHAIPVLRGNSARPLFITAAGIPLPKAAATVGAMAGSFRLPDALRRVDALARGRQILARPIDPPVATNDGPAA